MKTQFRAGDFVVTDFTPGGASYIIIVEGEQGQKYAMSNRTHLISAADASSGYLFLGYNQHDRSVIVLLNNSDGSIVQLYDDEVEKVK